MSGVRVINYLLANDAAVLAQVAAARTMSGTLPLNIALPAIGVKQVSGNEALRVNMSAGGRFQVDRVQVTVLASTYLSKKAILALVRTACATRRGSVNGVAVDSILPDAEGPDLDDPDTSIFEQSQDFMVAWTAAS